MSDQRDSWQVRVDEADVIENSAIGDLPIADLATWATRKPAPRQWILPGWIPSRKVKLLAGDGGVGKSLLAQQLATTLAAGQDFMGIGAPQIATTYITCEDDFDELEIRHETICDGLGLNRSKLSETLTLSSLDGEIGNHLQSFDKSKSMIASPRFLQIEEVCRRSKSRLIVLDNVAHFFNGNENERFEVAAFTGLLGQLAHAINGAVILLSHPAKATGSDFSGSTAWNNQVRARSFFENPTDGEGKVFDPDARILTRKKSNYAQKGEAIEMRYMNGIFVRKSDIHENTVTALAQVGRMNNENAKFLELLDTLMAQQRNVSHSPNARNYAPKVMAAMPAAMGIRKAEFERAMERLFQIDQIKAATKLWIGADRKPVLGIARKS